MTSFACRSAPTNLRQCDVSDREYLAATRHALLPQLMSGKLRVKDAEKSLVGVLRCLSCSPTHPLVELAEITIDERDPRWCRDQRRAHWDLGKLDQRKWLGRRDCFRWSMATSRKRGFAKTALSEGLKANGIGYIHLPALGNAKDNRDGYGESEGPAVEHARRL